MKLFTDGSAHPESKIGYGAYLAVEFHDQALPDVKTRRFENTSSTRLEIETLIWALQELKPCAITIYSDCQTIIGLPGRRERLEQKNFCSKSGVPLNHADLYREFFKRIDQFNCTFVKVKGHRRSKEKSPIEKLFTLVDRASREALRSDTRCI